MTSVALLGIPFDENSSFLRGAALAPARIREVLHSGASNLCTELGVDLETVGGWRDLGDLQLPGGPAALAQIEASARDLAQRGARVLALGGDHSISYPLVRACAAVHRDLTLVHFDAHPDLYDSLDGNRLSHASPFARIMEERLVRGLIQVGVRTFNPHQREQARRFGVASIEMRNLHRDVLAGVAAPLYVSLDLDVLDPAFAPGVSHHEPGGMSTRELLRILHALPGPIVAADLVEFNPARDPSGITAAAAAKLTKELLGRILT